MRGSIKVAHLELTQEADAHHLDTGKDKDSCNDEDGTMQRHDMLPGHDLEDEQPCGEPAAGDHAKSTEAAEEVQRPGHVAEQEADGEQIEEDAERARDAVVALPCRAGGVGDGDLADAGAVP